MRCSVVWTLGLLALTPAVTAQEPPKEIRAKSAATSAEQIAQLKEINQELAQLRQRVAQALSKIDYSEPNAADSRAAEPTEFVWIDDAPPAGANLQGDSPWEFVGKPHPVYSGEKSMRRSAQGISQHFFTDASYGLRIGNGDRLFTDVYLDPNSPPKTIMLQFNDGIWEHRSFWGDDSIPWGMADSPARHAMGALPKAGEWVRLEVNAAEVGLKPGAVLTGWAFTQHDGTVYWDKAGIVTRTPQVGQAFASLRAWEAFERKLPDSPLPPRVRAALTIEPAARNDAQTRLIRGYFLEHVYTKSRPTLEPLHQQIAALTQQRRELEAAQYQALLADFESALADSWTVLDLDDLKSANGATLAKEPDGSVLAGGANPPTDTYTFSAKSNLKGITALRLEVLPHDSLGGKGPGRAPHGNFVLSRFTVTAAEPGKAAEPVSFATATATFSQDGFSPDQAIEGVPQRGWAVAPRFGEAHTGVFVVRSAVGSGATTLTLSMAQDLGTQHTIGRFRISATNRWKELREKSVERLLEFAEQRGDAPAALDALMWVVTHAAETTQVDRAIELAAKDHIESKALLEVCQRLANAPLVNGERLLREVLEKSPHHDVQGWACFALAKDVAQRAGTDDELQAEVDKLLERVVNDFADVRSFGGSVGQWQRSIGRIAPEIEGEDIDGVTFKLSDYRGKVVVLDFWGHW